MDFVVVFVFTALCSIVVSYALDVLAYQLGITSGNRVVDIHRKALAVSGVVAVIVAGLCFLAGSTAMALGVLVGGAAGCLLWMGGPVD